MDDKDTINLVAAGLILLFFIPALIMLWGGAILVLSERVQSIRKWIKRR
jgi:hypothetical protein